MVSASDLWWHLASGREISRVHAIPAVDSFSFTFEGKPWTNHEWLWDLVYWWAYSAAPDAAAWLNLVVLVVTFAVLQGVLFRASGSAPASAGALVAAAATAHWFLDIRPHVFSLLFSAILLATRDRRWRVWLWPVLMIVWANVHAGFIFGIGIIGLFALIRTAAWLASGRKDGPPLREWAVLGACAAATVVNPYGASIIHYPLAYLDRTTPFRSLIEWMPPGVSLDPTAFNGRFFWLALLAAAGVVLGAWRIPQLALLAAVSFAMAITARRFIPLFAITGAPLVAIGLASAGASLARRIPALAGAWVRWGVLAAAGVLALVLWKDVRLSPRLLYRWTQGYVYPDAAVRYLDALPQARRPFNSYNYGGTIILVTPGRRVFIDSRANTLYDETTFRDYAQIFQARPGYEALLDRYRIDSVFIERDAPLRRALLAGPRPWVQVYSDRLAAILLKPDAAGDRPLPDAASLLAGDPETYYSAAQNAIAAGDLTEAARLAREAIRANPLLPPAYGMLAFIEGKRGDEAGLRTAIRSGIEAEPRWRPQFHVLEAMAYEQLGDTGKAAAAYRRGAPKGPFPSRQPGRTAAPKTSE